MKIDRERMERKRKRRGRGRQKNKRETAEGEVDKRMGGRLWEGMVTA